MPASRALAAGLALAPPFRRDRPSYAPLSHWSYGKSLVGSNDEEPGSHGQQRRHTNRDTRAAPARLATASHRAQYAQVGVYARFRLFFRAALRAADRHVERLAWRGWPVSYTHLTLPT